MYIMWVMQYAEQEPGIDGAKGGRGDKNTHLPVKK